MILVCNRLCRFNIYKSLALKSFGVPFKPTESQVVDAYRLKPVSEHLVRCGKPVLKQQIVSGLSEASIDQLNNGEIVVLENLRFHAKKVKFAGLQKSWRLSHLFVQDAFYGS